MSRVTEFFNRIAAMRPAEFGWSDVAEVIILALDRGDLDWREMLNPRSEYNKKKAAKHG